MRLTEMLIQVDTHTHTVLSGHAWSTLDENCRQAAALGMKGLCITEHGPAMRGAIEWFTLNSFTMLPALLHGVRLVPGVEFNIIDKTGTLDVGPERAGALEKVQFGIASMHDVIMPCTNKKDHTEAYIGALNNPHVKMLGHPGFAHFAHDPEPIVLEAKRLGKLIEINNNSFQARAGSTQNCIAFAKLCMRHEVPVCVSSDAHFYTMIGQVPKALQMLEDLSFPPELVLNLEADRFFDYLGL